jgi:hypothetical protein
MRLLTLLSSILFNQRSCRCNIRPKTLLFFGVMHLLTLLSHILFNQQSCRCNLRPTTLLFFGVMHLLTLFSSILFNQWLRKWSYRCNLRSTPLFSWRVTSLRKRLRQCNFWSILLFWFWFYTFYVISLAFLVLHLLNKRRVLLFLSSLPPSLHEVPFDWDGLVGYPMPPPMSFPGRDIILYITKTITSVSTLSSSTWRALGLPELVSVLRKILTFHIRSVREPWPPLGLAT